MTYSCHPNFIFPLREWIKFFFERFIHSVFSLTTGPKPPPKRFPHIERSRASSFKWEYPLLSLMASSSFLRLLPRLLVTSISPFIFLKDIIGKICNLVIYTFINWTNYYNISINYKASFRPVGINYCKKFLVLFNSNNFLIIL